MSGATISESGIVSSALRTAWLILCQLMRTGQRGSCAQRPCVVEHSVIPIGPSRAPMMSPIVMRAGSLARL